MKTTAQAKKSWRSFINKIVFSEQTPAGAVQRAGSKGGFTVGKFYSDWIREILASNGYLGVDPRHVEAYMRVEHSTLDGLSVQAFVKEVQVGIECVRAGGAGAAEDLAESFGL
jgi:hypothetical protein